MSYGAEIVELSKQFFQDGIDYSNEAKAVLEEEQVPEVLQAFYEKIAALEPFEADRIKKAMKDVQKETGHKGKKLFMPIRVAVTGETRGPELPDAIELLGKEKVKNRLERLIR
jgi:nondiscriminating glutamyl-tRNA synthetase